MNNRLSKITIVGGGTAGWMTALILETEFSHTSAPKDRPRICLIESPNIATVGVGEATVPEMPRRPRLAGISERDFFRETNASFKLGVKFCNWNRDAKGRRIDYVNPFAYGQMLEGVDASEYFLRFGNGDMDFTQSITPHDDLARHCKGARPLGAPEFQQRFGYAYHLDAVKFAGMLARFCTKRGVEHIRDALQPSRLSGGSSGQAGLRYRLWPRYPRPYPAAEEAGLVPVLQERQGRSCADPQGDAGSQDAAARHPGGA